MKIGQKYFFFYIRIRYIAFATFEGCQYSEEDFKSNLKLSLFDLRIVEPLQIMQDFNTFHRFMFVKTLTVLFDTGKMGCLS